MPQSWQVFTAIYHGFVKQAGIIVFILVVGGAFWLLNATGAVSAGIGRFIARVGHRDKWVLVGITLLFSLAGAIFGMSEETIPFVGMVVPLMLSLGYDAFMGMLIVYVAANVGFSAAFFESLHGRHRPGHGRSAVILRHGLSHLLLGFSDCIIGSVCAALCTALQASGGG